MACQGLPGLTSEFDPSVVLPGWHGAGNAFEADKRKVLFFVAILKSVVAFRSALGELRSARSSPGNPRSFSLFRSLGLELFRAGTVVVFGFASVHERVLRELVVGLVPANSQYKIKEVSAEGSYQCVKLMLAYGSGCFAM